MPTRLSRMRLDKVDLVDVGADEHATVAIFKRDTDHQQEATPMAADTKDKATDPVTPDEPVEKADTPDRPDRDPAEVDTVAKADYEALLKRAEQAEKIAKEERDLRMRRELRKRVDDVGVTGDRDKVTDLLHRIGKADPDAVDNLLEVFAAYAEQLRESNLFAATGSSAPDGGDAEAQIEKIAKTIRDGQPDLTAEQAYTRAVEQNPKLYARMLQEA